MFINYDPETSPRMNKRTDTGSFWKVIYMRQILVP